MHSLHVRRLAARLLAISAAAFLVLSCADSQPTDLAVSGADSATDLLLSRHRRLATITVAPNPDTLGEGGTQSFTAVGRDRYGDVVSIAPAWSVAAGGGTITSAGLFTAGAAAGTFVNTVRAASGGIFGSATVTVRSSALASITVTPSADTLRIGGSQQFVAVGRDSAGNVVAITPTWSVVTGGGTITATGLFTAGTGSGTYANTIQASSGGVTGTASVTVLLATLASITVTPSLDSLRVGGVQQFTAAGRDAAGNAVAITPTWSVAAGGGTINSSGGFTAGTVAGTYANTVRATSAGISGAATVAVAPGTISAGSSVVSVSSGTVAVGGAVTLILQGKDASGNNLTSGGASVTFSASGGTSTGTITATTDRGNGTYSATFTGSTAGTATTIHATIGGSTVTGTLPTITVTAGSDEPVDPGSGYLFADNFDRYASPIAMTASGSCPSGTAGFGLPSAQATYGMRTITYNGGCNLPDGHTPADGAYQIVSPGHGGSGQALRNHFVLDNTGAQTNAYAWSAPSTHLSYSGTLIVQWWFYGSSRGPGWYNYGKWMELVYNQPTYNRIQLGVGINGSKGSHGTWAWNPGSAGEFGDQPVGPYPEDVMKDGQWHRMTIAYRPNTTGGSPSSRDGFARAWVDGTKIVDLSASAASVTPPGGTNAWCTLAGVDALGAGSTVQIIYVTWPRLQNSSDFGAYDMDFDDLKIWVTP